MVISVFNCLFYCMDIKYWITMGKFIMKCSDLGYCTNIRRIMINVSIILLIMGNLSSKSRNFCISRNLWILFDCRLNDLINWYICHSPSYSPFISSRSHMFHDVFFKKMPSYLFQKSISSAIFFGQIDRLP